MHKLFTRHGGLFLFILFALGHVTIPTRPALAVPAAGIVEPLTQPDGTLVWAHQIGDEWANGMATPDGYLILRDPGTLYWRYAEAGPDGSLRASALIVGQHAPAGIPRGLRPARSLPALAIAEDDRTAAGLPAPAPALGSRALLTLFVDFTPSVRVGATPSSLNNTLFGPTGSAKKYYEETSYGGFTLVSAVESDVTLGGSVNDGVVTVTLPYAHPNTAGTTDDRNRRIVREALLAADAFVDFAGYDTNGDGVIAANELNLLVVVAGYEAAYSTPCGNSIWAHKWNLFGTVPTVTLDGKTVGGTYTQMGEWHCAASAPPGHQATMGPAVHEVGHDLGLPDLYDTDDSSEGIGNWGLMGGGGWNRVTVPGDSPAHLDAWSKYALGWITPTVVTGTLSNETISPAATTADVYQFLAGTPTTGEYFLVENRQRVGFDAGLPGQGLLIWHVDTAKTTNREECFPGGPSCATYHYKVAVVQADNLSHLEKGENRSCGGDPWPGTYGKQTFNDASTPNSWLYSGASSAVSITGITAIANVALGRPGVGTFARQREHRHHHCILGHEKGGTGEVGLSALAARINDITTVEHRLQPCSSLQCHCEAWILTADRCVRILASVGSSSALVVPWATFESLDYEERRSRRGEGAFDYPYPRGPCIGSGGTISDIFPDAQTTWAGLSCASFQKNPTSRTIWWPCARPRNARKARCADVEPGSEGADQGEDISYRCHGSRGRNLINR
jgi:M6 family metalloprotease-like protein